MSTDRSNFVNKLGKEYAENNHDRIRTMVSDQKVKDEYDKWVSKDPAEVFFWKVMWTYISPIVETYYMFQALVVVRRKDGDEQAFQELIKAFEEANFEVIEYKTVPKLYVDNEGKDKEEMTNLSLGRSTIWDIPTAQYFAKIEITSILEKYNVMNRRIGYWTIPGKDLPPNVPKDKIIYWFSYESHGSIEDMLYKNWQAKTTFIDTLFLGLSGITTILYSGLIANRSLAEAKATFYQLYKLMGLTMAISMTFYRCIFANYEGASNVAIMYRSNVYDYREPVSKDVNLSGHQRPIKVVDNPLAVNPVQTID